MKRCLFATLVLLLGASVVAAAADDAVSTARDLYAAAAYEDALVVLNRLRGSQQPSGDARTIEQYRAFCLLALGRRDDAEQAIAAVITKEPSYQPSDPEVSPRVRSVFSEVRRRMLPTIVQEKYAAGKEAFDRKDFAAAAYDFKQVLDLLADPDLGLAATQSPLSDLRTLAAGFRDLSTTAASPAPPPPPPAPTAPIVAAPEAPAGPGRGHIYGVDDAGVVPPVVVRQSLPLFELRTPAPPGQGVLEIVIGETGAVEAAIMRSSVFPRYDSVVLETARTWQYKPATLHGIPVMYRKLIAIAVKRSS